MIPSIFGNEQGRMSGSSLPLRDGPSYASHGHYGGRYPPSEHVHAGESSHMATREYVSGSHYLPYPSTRAPGNYSPMAYSTHLNGQGAVSRTPYGVLPDPGGDYHGDHGMKRRRGNLPRHVTDLLKSWFKDHVTHPYPSEEEKQMLMCQTGLTITQVR